MSRRNAIAFEPTDSPSTGSTTPEWNQSGFGPPLQLWAAVVADVKGTALKQTRQIRHRRSFPAPGRWHLYAQQTVRKLDVIRTTKRLQLARANATGTSSVSESRMKP